MCQACDLGEDDASDHKDNDASALVDETCCAAPYVGSEETDSDAAADAAAAIRSNHIELNSRAMPPELHVMPSALARCLRSRQRRARH